MYVIIVVKVDSNSHYLVPGRFTRDQALALVQSWNMVGTIAVEMPALLVQQVKALKPWVSAA